MKLLDGLIEELKPAKKEEQEMIDKVNAFIKKIKIRGAKAVLGGSGEKGTWLRGKFDADVFVLFDYKFKEEDISNILGTHLKKVFKKVDRVHGSRDYFQIYDGGFLFEIIPILEIRKAEQAQNITDVSPLHAKWVKKKTTQKMADEVRLLKQFCMAQEVYGAESYIQGFSGYVCEILIVYYKSFVNLLKKSAGWKSKTVIDAEGHWRGKNILMELNKSKLQSPLIVIDPVQKDRNAAAALSYEKFEKFQKAARKFLKEPSKKSFEKKEMTLDQLKKKGGNKRLVVLDIEVKAGKEDIVGSRLLKCLNYIRKMLAENDFIVFDYGWSWDKKKKARYWFILDKKELEREKKQIGPPMQAIQFVMEFKKRHKKTFIEKNRVCAMVKRRFVRAEDLIWNLIEDKNVKRRIKRLNKIAVYC